MSEEYTQEDFKQFILENLPQEHSETVRLPHKWDEWEGELLEWFDEVGIRVVRVQKTSKFAIARLSWASNGSHLKLVTNEHGEVVNEEEIAEALKKAKPVSVLSAEEVLKDDFKYTK